MSKGKKVTIGAGVAAVALASAGAYYLLGPNKKAHQKKTRILMAKMEKELKSEWKGAPKTVKKSVRKIKKNLPSSVI